MPRKAEPTHQPTLFELERASEPTGVRPSTLPSILLGTSSFTASGWEGSFYPLGMQSKDFRRHYAKEFQTVEIDSTFYGTTSPWTVTSWLETVAQFAFLEWTEREKPESDYTRSSSTT